MIGDNVPGEQENEKYISYDLVNALHALFPYNTPEFARALRILPTIVDPKFHSH